MLQIRSLLLKVVLAIAVVFASPLAFSAPQPRLYSPLSHKLLRMINDSNGRFVHVQICRLSADQDPGTAEPASHACYFNIDIAAVDLPALQTLFEQQWKINSQLITSSLASNQNAIYWDVLSVAYYAWLTPLLARPSLHAWYVSTPRNALLLARITPVLSAALGAYFAWVTYSTWSTLRQAQVSWAALDHVVPMILPSTAPAHAQIVTDMVLYLFIESIDQALDLFAQQHSSPPNQP
jgi:hypothetical protein